jgi:hypothetical protein
MNKLLQDKTIKIGLFGIAGVIILVIGLLIPVGIDSDNMQLIEVDIANMKISDNNTSALLARSLNQTGELSRNLSELSKRMDLLGPKIDTGLQEVSEVSVSLNKKLDDDRQDILYLLTQVADLKALGNLDQNTVKALQDSFDKLTSDFAVLVSGQAGRVEVREVTLANTGYIGTDCLMAEVIVIIENTSMYDVKDRYLNVVIKADSDIPAIKTATLGGYYALTSWQYQLQEGRYIFFQAAEPVNIKAHAVIGMELKLKLIFSTKLTSVTSFEAEVSIN